MLTSVQNLDDIPSRMHRYQVAAVLDQGPTSNVCLVRERPEPFAHENADQQITAVPKSWIIKVRKRFEYEGYGYPTNN